MSSPQPRVAPAAPSDPTRTAAGAKAWLVMAAVVLLAFNLRPTAVSVGPVLAEVTAGLGMSHTTAGLLTSLPVLAFAVFGAASPWAARIVGLHRVTALALLAVVIGLAGRAAVSSTGVFLLLSMLALAGMAAANILLPSLVKLHFAHRTGLVTAAYTTALAVGLTAALTLTVPVAEAFGSWRAGLAVWAALGAVAALPWLFLVTHDKRASKAAGGEATISQVARTRLGWAMALFFGLQSSQAYSIFGWFPQLWRDAGYSPAQAGALVGLLAAITIPMSLWLPAAAARRTDQRTMMTAVALCFPVGYLGLLWAPYSGAVLWALVVGMGSCCFTLVLTLIALRSSTPAGTAALSGFTQSVGYLVSAVGPFAVGALYETTGGWTAPIWLLLAMSIPQIALGRYIARPLLIEDQLPS